MSNRYRSDYACVGDSRLYQIANNLVIDAQSTMPLLKFQSDREYIIVILKDQLIDILRDIGNHLDDRYYHSDYLVQGIRLEYDINPNLMDRTKHVRLSFRYKDQIICYACSKEMMLGIIFENLDWK